MDAHHHHHRCQREQKPGERAELGPQLRTLEDSGLYVLPSTSPANAAVPYDERLRWFRALREWIEPVVRDSVRAFVVDAERRVLLMQWVNPVSGVVWWITPGGGVEAGEDADATLRRELAEEAGLLVDGLGPVVRTRELVLPRDATIVRQREAYHLVRVDRHDLAPTIDLAAENVHGHRWWTAEELEATPERFAPPELPAILRGL
jgi:8-oxo-dGTP pyrophosphatase MutT (NUDIX family)